MSASVQFSGAGIRIGDMAIIVADSDGQVMVHVGDASCSAAIALPPEAARHMAERLTLKAAEVERAAAYPADAPPCVPRPASSIDSTPRG